jgi:hypothetical protein
MRLTYPVSHSHKPSLPTFVGYMMLIKYNDMGRTMTKFEGLTEFLDDFRKGHTGLRLLTASTSITSSEKLLAVESPPSGFDAPMDVKPHGSTSGGEMSW